MHRVLALSLPLALAACFAPTTATQRLGDAAYEMNTATRFGRLDVAMEHILPKDVEAWQKHHAGWGSQVRIVDVEMGGVSVTSKDEASVLVSFTWQRANESTIRTTTLLQKWRDDRGTWHLTDESAKAGDATLLADEKAATKGDAKDAAPPQKNRFQTHVIYEEDSGG